MNQHGGISIIIWVCVASSDPGLSSIDGTQILNDTSESDEDISDICLFPVISTKSPVKIKAAVPQMAPKVSQSHRHSIAAFTFKTNRQHLFEDTEQTLSPQRASESLPQLSEVGRGPGTESCSL